MKPSVNFQDNFTDLNSLNAIKQVGRKGDKAALQEVARQFEALFLQQLLKTMRATEDVFADGNFTQSSEMKFHRDLLDQQMSLQMTQGRGLGLAEVLYRQLDRDYGKLLPAAKPSDESRPQSGLESRARLSTPAPVPTNPAPLVQGPETADPVAKKQNFLESIVHEAKKAADTLGVAVEGILAQVALETGWGEHTLRDAGGTSSHNLFNIKAGEDWQGPRVQKTVVEFEGNQRRWELASFRGYNSLQEAFTDFTRFLSKPRYAAAAGQSTAEGYAQALQSAGYATDPEYASKITRIAQDPVLLETVARNLL